MPDEFPKGVFLSLRAKKQSVVRDAAERLKKDGVTPKSEGCARIEQARNPTSDAKAYSTCSPKT
jgi:hypothetical protein